MRVAISPTMTVRDTQPQDIEAALQVDAAAIATLRQTYRPNQKALANRKRLSPHLKRIVCLMNGRVVGTTQYYQDGDSLRLLGLGVLPEARRHGVARAMVAALADSARSLGLRSLMAHTVRETGNVPIFQKLGFRVVSEMPDEYCESDKYPALTDVVLQMDL